MLVDGVKTLPDLESSRTHERGLVTQCLGLDKFVLIYASSVVKEAHDILNWEFI